MNISTICTYVYSTVCIIALVLYIIFHTYKKDSIAETVLYVVLLVLAAVIGIYLTLMLGMFAYIIIANNFM